jgi:hypothetical protein
VTTNVNIMSTPVSTPVYDSDRTAVLEVISSSTRRPPRHLDIYGQLCWEFGADPRSSDFGSLPPHHRANAFPTRPTRSSRPTEPAPAPVQERRRSPAHALAPVQERRPSPAHTLPWWHGSPQLR